MDILALVRLRGTSSNTALPNAPARTVKAAIAKAPMSVRVHDGLVALPPISPDLARAGGLTDLHPVLATVSSRIAAAIFAGFSLNKLAPETLAARGAAPDQAALRRRYLADFATRMNAAA